MPDLTPALRRIRLPFKLRVEPRMQQPGWLAALISLGAVALALVLGGIVLLLVGGSPLRAYAFMLKAAFGDIGVFSDTLTKATPLILVSLAAVVAFRMRLWNIGAEGQFFIGAFGASAVVLTPILPPETSPWLMIPTMMAVGAMTGAIYGIIPGFLKARFNVNEIISTLLMNYIAVAWNNFFIFAIWSEGGFQMSRQFPKTAWLPRLTDYSSQVPIFRGLTTHLGLVIGLAAAVLVWWILYRSRWGYEIRLIGDNPRAARYAGINIMRNTILVMMLSGALAGLGGMSEISGVVHRLQGAISPGYGFTGIIVAWLAKLNPLLVIPISILFGGLLLAGREIQPSGIPMLIQGIILVCLIASDFLLRNRISILANEQEA
ncbi:MAG: ABC transporter permease [Anaerolineales bacterium]|nr:MAG: ABC transporter permease [Anaerolineales bacterium]